MSDAIEDPTTAEGLPDTGSTGAEPGEDANDQSNEMTLMEKIRNDPEFAVEQIKKRDVQISEKANKLKQLELLDTYVQQAGGSEQLLDLAMFGSQARGVPGLGEFVQKSIQEGRIALPEPAPQDDPAEEWMDEDTRKVRDESRQEIADLRQMVSELRSSVTSAGARSQEVHVRGNIDKALEIFGGAAEGRQEAMDLIESHVKGAQLRAEGGDVNQAKLIDKLAGPEGKQILNSIIYESGLIQKYGRQIYATDNTQTDQVASTLGKATDAQSKVSRPNVPTIERPPKGSAGTAGAFLSVLNQVRKANGRSAV